MTTSDATPEIARWRIASAFAAIYLIWGTTYFVIGEVVRDWPPFLMTAARFVVAGSVLYAFRRLRGTPAPSRANWIAAAWVGALLLLGGYGATAWAQQRVPSGITALMITITPLLMVLVEWLRPGGRRPGPRVAAGLALGIGGTLLLIGPARLDAARDADIASLLACGIASASWAAGSVLSRQARQADDPFLAAAMQMLLGTVWLTAASALTGEFARIPGLSFQPRLISGWLYLTFAGSLAAFSAYVYLLKHSTPARVSTYAYVNPAIAVFVGWIFGEIVTPRVLLAGALLLAGVALITLRKPRRA